MAENNLCGVIVCVEAYKTENAYNINEARSGTKDEWSCSGVLVSSKLGIVLTSGSILTDLIDNGEDLDNNNGSIIGLSRPIPPHIASAKFSVILSENDNEINNTTNFNSTIRKNAELLCMWNYVELEQHINRIFHDSIKVADPSNTSHSTSNSTEEHEHILRRMNTTFLLLQLDSTSGSLSLLSSPAVFNDVDKDNVAKVPVQCEDNPHPIKMQDIMANEEAKAVTEFLKNSNLKLKIVHEFIQELWFRTVDTVSSTNQKGISKGDTVWSESSLFGSLSPFVFMNSLSKGIIVNSTGPLLITDARCAPGSEGGLVFTLGNNNERQWVGIVCLSLTWKQNDVVGFSIACSARSLLLDLLNKSNVLHSHLHQPSLAEDQLSLSSPIPSLTSTTHSVVMVKVGSTWGSGIVIDRDNGLILTCAHVVEGSQTAIVKVEYPDTRQFSCDVIYRNPSGEPLDLAILKLPLAASTTTSPLDGMLSKRSHGMEQAVCSADRQPELGEEVFAIGYAIFPDYCKLGLLVTSGVVSKLVRHNNIATLMQTTCAVYAGASGGAIVSAKTGELLGMIMCNSRDVTNSTTYPNINLSVPTAVVLPVVQEYLQYSDISVLKKLHYQDGTLKRMWNITSSSSRVLSSKL